MSGMKLVVKTVTHVTIGVIMVFGGYLTLEGHVSAGGGVAGGVVVALALILYVLAYGSTKAEERLDRRLANILLTSSSTLLLIIALLGYIGGYFFSNFLPAGGVILLCNFCLMVLISSSLFLIFLNLSAFRISASEGKK